MAAERRIGYGPPRQPPALELDGTSDQPGPGAEAAAGQGMQQEATGEQRPVERLDVLEAIGDAAADLEEAWPLAEPAPALQRARADVPAASQIGLVQMPDGHGDFPRRPAGKVAPRQAENRAGDRQKNRQKFG
ncbi:MAG: hypothetical protein QJR07_12075 [Acetobacteraceae bacterium]|nr:hypothetical protein [Acetobacteraceae bacterium]